LLGLSSLSLSLLVEAACSGATNGELILVGGLQPEEEGVRPLVILGLGRVAKEPAA
jgi:hypothetical protein